MPWITLNGEEYGDSTLCFELLAAKFDKDLSSHLSEEEKSVARAFQILAEEHLYWCRLYYDNPNYFKPSRVFKTF